MLYLETGLSALHIFPAVMNFRYIHKVLSMSEYRLQRILANYLMQEQEQWVIEWIRLQRPTVWRQVTKVAMGEKYYIKDGRNV